MLEFECRIESFGAFAAWLQRRGARCGHFVRVDPQQQTRGTTDSSRPAARQEPEWLKYPAQDPLG
ncbi:hypothetical protein, partial [Streptomyces sp. NRRL S-1896]|uniref:hypothetical protein n=1 Tax=Streptomyces sp. NRRL S-1896 TaxID=1463893 RepID=UPI001F379F09